MQHPSTPLKTILFLLFCGLYYYNLDNCTNTNVLFISTCTLFLFLNRQHPNITTWISIILFIEVLEIVSLYNANFVLDYLAGITLSNIPYAHYLIQISCDIMAIYLINRRWYIYFAYFPGAKREDACYSNADSLLMLIYLLHAIIGVASIVETLIRSPSDILLPQEWARPDIRFIYDNFLLFKGILSIGVVALLWGNITEYFQKSGKFYRA